MAGLLRMWAIKVCFLSNIILWYWMELHDDRKSCPQKYIWKFKKWYEIFEITIIFEIGHCVFIALIFFVSSNYKTCSRHLINIWINEWYYCHDWISGIIECEVAQLGPTLCDPMDCSLPGSSVHGIFQRRILEWVATSFSRRSSWPRDWTWVSCIVGRRFTIWATREAIECH